MAISPKAVSATETFTIDSFTVNSTAQTCVVNSHITMSWTSGVNACSSVTNLTTTISGSNFTAIFGIKAVGSTRLTDLSDALSTYIYGTY